MTILSAFEHLERLPTCYFTGYFVAIRASKPGPLTARNNGRKPAENKRI